MAKPSPRPAHSLLTSASTLERNRTCAIAAAKGQQMRESIDYAMLSWLLHTANICYLCAGLCSQANWPITSDITTMSAHTSVTCATRRLLILETCRSTLSFTQVSRTNYSLTEQRSLMWICLFLALYTLTQGKNLSCVTNVAEASTEWTICGPTSRPFTTAKPG